MTKRSLMNVVVIVSILYLIPLSYGIWLPIHFGSACAKDKLDVLTKIVGLLTPIPAAWLVFSFQRRSSYLQQLRTVWSKAIDAVEQARQYTHLSSPTQADFSQVSVKLSCIQEEIRGVFKSHDEKPLPKSIHAMRITDPKRKVLIKTSTGIYPFESMKSISSCIRALGFGTAVTESRATAARFAIDQHWKKLRLQLLREFDRDVPTYIDTPYKHPRPKADPPPARDQQTTNAGSEADSV